MFALAMFRIAGRGGPRDRDEAARLLAAAAKLGHVVAAYDLALLYLEGQLFPQDFARAAELFRSAAEAGNPEAQYALATLYKEGRGVPKDLREAARLARRGGARRRHLDAEVEYAHRAVQRHRRRQERGAPPALSSARPRARATRSRRTGSPACYATGRGMHGRSGRGRQVAPDRQGRRRQRPFLDEFCAR